MQTVLQGASTLFHALNNQEEFVSAKIKDCPPFLEE